MAENASALQPDEMDGYRSRHLSAKLGCCHFNPSKEATRMQITTIGLDLAKHVSQVHAADSDEAGHAFQSEVGHCFRHEAGQCSDLKPAT